MADGTSSPASNTNTGVNIHDGLNNTLPPDAMLAAVEDAALDTTPDAVPNAMPPPPKPVETRQVSLTFNGSAGESVTFKLKNTMKLRKAMDHYSAKVQRPVDQLRFLFEGQRLGSEDTPAAHEMEDGDVVEVHMEQLGGGATEDKDLEDWVVVVSDEGLLERTLAEKARLCRLLDRLKQEHSALKTNNRFLGIHNRELLIKNLDCETNNRDLETNNRDLETKNRELLIKTLDLANGNHALAAHNHELLTNNIDLGTNNRALAKENNSLKTEKTELNDDNSELFAEFTQLLTAYQGVSESLDKFKTNFDKETSALKASIARKDRTIDNFQTAFERETSDLKASMAHKDRAIDRFQTAFDKETSHLKASIANKDHAIDSILKDFKFTMTPEGI